MPGVAADRKRNAPGDRSTPTLICELCRQFYGLGWVSGTGGGISIRDAEGVWIAPSGVQKERLEPDQVFLVSDQAWDRVEVLAAPERSQLAHLRVPAAVLQRLSQP